MAKKGEKKPKQHSISAVFINGGTDVVIQLSEETALTMSIHKANQLHLALDILSEADG